MSYALLIDDDATLVQSLTSLVSESGLELDSAATWDEGLARFLATSPELVVADYNLPGSKHGLRLLFDIARLRPTVRLVLFSAYVTEEDIKLIQDIGLADLALRKTDPLVSGRVLLKEVEAARDRAGAATDWTEFGRAAKRARRITDAGFEELDGFLRTHRLPGAKEAK